MQVVIDFEELLAERGIDVSHETIRRWVAVFGPTIARRLRAALRLMRKLIRKYRMVPSTFVTDRLPSYAAAKAELPLPIAHERGLRQNNRAESSHVPVRRRERKMQRFRSAGSAQRFLSTHASVYNTFNICRHLITSATKRRFRAEAFEAWRAAAGIAA